MTKEYHDEETLRRLHWDEGLSLREIGRRYDVSHRTIGYWFDKHDMDRRGVGGEQRYASYGLYHETADTSEYARWRTKHDHEDYRVRVHRLLATLLVDDISELKGKHVHHKIPIGWLNYEDNLEVLTPEEHAEIHNESDAESSDDDDGPIKTDEMSPVELGRKAAQNHDIEFA